MNDRPCRTDKMATSFRSIVVRSSAVNVLMSVGLRIGLFLQTVIYANIFVPAQLGQLAAVIIIINTFGTLGNFGAGEAIIRERESEKEIMDAAFTIAAAISVLGVVLLFFGAPIISGRMENAPLSGQLRFMLPLLFATPLSVPNLLYVKNFRFGLARLPAVLDLLVSCIVTIGLHLILGLGLPSLFIGKLAGFAANYCSIWLMAIRRPHFAFAPKIMLRLYRFGWPILVAGIANYVIIQGDSLVVSYYCGSENLAFYSLAFSLPFYLRELSDILSSSLLPTYSYLRESRERTINAFLKTNRYLQLLVLPCSIALIAFAEPIIRLLYGPNWLPCIPLLRILALAFTIQMSCGYTWGILCLAWAKVKYLMAVKLWMVFFFFASAPLLIKYYGTMGGAYYALASAAITVAIVRFFILYRELRSFQFAIDSIAPIVSGLVASLISAPIGSRWADNLFSLCILLAGYYLLYFALLLGIDRNARSEIRTLVLEFKKWIFSQGELSIPKA